MGCLVEDRKIKTVEEIYLFSLPIKEFEVIDFFLGCPSRMRIYNGHVVLGVKCSQEVAIAIHGANIWRHSASSYAVRTLGELDQQAPYHCLQGDLLLWLCAAGTLFPAPPPLRHCHYLGHCA
ncbi:hypothetical protein GH733_010575 [Mirounga leonina]|nr:hypothetical protein GH733_010575 [Mirounga leonina]